MRKLLHSAYLLFFVSLSVILNSCNTKSIKYFEHKNRSQNDSVWFYPNGVQEEYKLHINDLLYIKILTTDNRINALFNIGENASNNSRSSQGGEFFLSGFTVNDTGYIKVPVLGDFKVVGKTMPEVRKMVQARTDELLIKAITNVKLVSYKISFIGEVNTQGSILIYQERIDFPEALARVGGLTEYADIKHVKVLRPDSNGYTEFYVDLSDINFLKSQNIYLYPNDLVIVDENKNKAFRNATQDYFMLVSMLTSTISIFFLIWSFKK
jgi:polysaccharide export outer membrane protein